MLRSGASPVQVSPNTRSKLLFQLSPARSKLAFRRAPRVPSRRVVSINAAAGLTKRLVSLNPCEIPSLVHTRIIHRLFVHIFAQQMQVMDCSRASWTGCFHLLCLHRPFMMWTQKWKSMQVSPKYCLSLLLFLQSLFFHYDSHFCKREYGRRPERSNGYGGAPGGG